MRKFCMIMMLVVGVVWCGLANAADGDGCPGTNIYPNDYNLSKSVFKNCYSNSSGAYGCYADGNLVSGWSVDPESSSVLGQNCLTSADYYFYHSNGKATKVSVCYSCNYGYELELNSSTYANNGVKSCCPVPSTSGCNTTRDALFRYATCVQDCQESNCPSDTTWTKAKPGYEQQLQRSCTEEGPEGDCQETGFKYRCAAGYYKSDETITEKSGCTECPVLMLSHGVVYTDAARTVSARGTSNAGSDNITGCYITPGTYYDAAGTFEIFAGNCEVSPD